MRPPRLERSTYRSEVSQDHAFESWLGSPSHANLLRVRLIEPDKNNPNEKMMYDRMVKGMLTTGLSVAGRHYMYFAHKDADKAKTRQLWLGSCDPNMIKLRKDNGLRSIQNARSLVPPSEREAFAEAVCDSEDGPALALSCPISAARLQIL